MTLNIVLEEKKESVAELQKSFQGDKASKNGGSLHTQIELEYEALLMQVKELKAINRGLLDERDETLNQNRLESLPSISEELNLEISSSSVSFEDDCFRTSGLLRIESSDFDQSSASDINIKKLRGIPMLTEGIQRPTRHSLGSNDKKSQNNIFKNLSFDNPIRKLSASLSSESSNANYGTISAQLILPVKCQASIFKLLIVGNSGVGKTCIVQRFCNDVFNDSYHETIGMEFQIKTIVLESGPHLLQIWDSAGQARFRPLISQCVSKVDGLIFVYTLDSITSLDEFFVWAHQLFDGNIIKEMHFDKEKVTPMMLLANKFDLIDVKGNQESSLEIDLDQLKEVNAYVKGLQVAKDNGALHFPISAKTGYNILPAFKMFVTRLKEIEESQLEKVMLSTSNVSSSSSPCCCCLCC